MKTTKLILILCAYFALNGCRTTSITTTQEEDIEEQKEDFFMQQLEEQNTGEY